MYLISQIFPISIETIPSLPGQNCKLFYPSTGTLNSNNQPTPPPPPPLFSLSTLLPFRRETQLSHHVVYTWHIISDLLNQKCSHLIQISVLFLLMLPLTPSPSIIPYPLNSSFIFSSTGLLGWQSRVPVCDEGNSSFGFIHHLSAVDGRILYFSAFLLPINHSKMAYFNSTRRPPGREKVWMHQ